MTYTNGYQAQNSGASPYSPFSRTGNPNPSAAYSGYPEAVPTNNYGAVQAPAMGQDTFLPPKSSEDIDTLSSNIDTKIAQIRQAFSQGAAPTMPGTQAPQQAPAAPPVPEADIQWALQLEQKVKTQNYQPNPQEVAKYEDIAKKLAAAQSAPQQAPAQQPQAPAASPVPEADIQWALQLEQKVKTQNYQPNPQEVAKYEDIAKKLAAAQSAPQQAPAQQPQAPAAPPVPEADIQWALQLEQKVKTQNYQPNPQEVAKYEDIAKKLAAAQSAPQQPAQAPAQQQGPRNWSDWSKPYTVPAAPNMPLPIAGPGGQPIVNVPTSLRGAPQTPPAAMLNQAPGTQMAPQQPQQAAANVSQQEIQWALDLEKRVNDQKYQPNPQEMAQYQNIAQRLAAAQQAPQQAAAPQMPQQQAMAPAQQPAMPQQAPAVSQQEVQWALDLEKRVNEQKYQPNPQEMAAYQSIAQKLSAAQQAPQQPAAPQMPQQQPMAPQQPQYQAPVQQPAMPQQAPAVSQQEVQWALDLEKRVNEQKYQPNPQEMAAYQSIAQKLSAAQQAPQQPQVPAQQTMMPPQQPQFQAPAPQQAAPQALPNGLTQQDIQWALQLEQRVNTQNYQPNPQEMAAYQNISQRLNSAPAPQQQPQFQAPVPQQPGLPQYQAPQYLPQQMAPPTQPTQIVPSNYPMVQPQTPQMLMTPQQQLALQYPQQPGMPQPNGPMPQQMPQQMLPPGQQQGPQGPQKPGFMDRAKAAWSTLWG